MTRILYVTASVLLLLCAGCGAVQVGPQASVPAKADIRRVAPQEAERLYSIMVPLLRHMDNPREPNEVRIGIIDDAQINAANAGGGNFYSRGDFSKRPAMSNSGE